MFKILLVIIIGSVMETFLDNLIGFKYSDETWSLVLLIHNVSNAVFGGIIALMVLNYMGVIKFE